MDILDLDVDPDVLDATASVIEGYCNRQNCIMDEYLNNISSLSSEWTDNQTLGTLLGEIKILRNSVVTLMDEIKSKYPAYFRKKADEIRNRPKF